MSTATTSRPVGDNEFPVLLRLPDLNASAWLPVPVAAPQVVPTPAPELAVATPMWTAPVEIPSSPLPTPALATTSIDVTLPAITKAVADTTTTATVTPAARTERVARLERIQPAQWTLIRQLATGGVLVGGLALTYFMIMGGSDQETPEHVATAETTLEPPVIETPTNVLASNPSTPNETRFKPDSSTPSDIRPVGPPPDFSREFSASPAMPPHIEVADLTQREAAPNRSANPAPQNSGAPVQPQDNLGQFRGRIGPESQPLSQQSTAYPTTDPATFLYRPNPMDGANEAARTARLNGTIAPPPLR